MGRTRKGSSKSRVENEGPPLGDRKLKLVHRELLYGAKD